MSWVRSVFVIVFSLVTGAAMAEAPDQKMTVERLGQLLEAVDEGVSKGSEGHIWSLTIEDVKVTVIADPEADRMRMIVPIMDAKDLTETLQMRVLQANFDTALDARYAVAKGTVWSTFIHPLGALTDRQALSGLGQTVNLVKSFGTTFSSGALLFGGGDSEAMLRRQLIDRLLQKRIEI